MKKIKYKNIGKETIRFQIGTKPGFAPEQYVIEPGEECEVPAGYCQAAGPRKSFIERRGKGMLVPSDEAPKARKEPEMPIAAKEEPEAEVKAEEPKKEAKKSKKKSKKKAKKEESKEISFDMFEDVIKDSKE